VLQLMPLFIEFALLAATAYLYWLTRKLAAGSSSPLLTGQHTENQAETANVEQVQMMQDVTALLNEWQAAANATREEWLYQQTHLQTMLKQAETTIAELHLLIAQAEIPLKTTATMPQPQPVAPENCIPLSSSFPTLPVSSLAEAPMAFVNYLRQRDYNQRTIARVSSQVQNFVAWLEGKNSTQVLLHRITPIEIRNYGQYLTVQSTQPDYIERELTTIRMFANWVNDVCNCRHLQNAVELNHSASLSPSPVQPSLPSVKMPLSHGTDRYRNVFTLADQGLDPADITAQTGLEREAVRLLLSMGSPS
jgi:hypothetical protein